MSRNSSLATRRSVLATSAAARSRELPPAALGRGGTTLKPTLDAGRLQNGCRRRNRSLFFHAPEAELADLPRRINATRRPERLTGCAARHDSKAGALVRDGVRLAQVQARLNALPNFITNVDGLDIPFIHARPKQNALPMLATHGWPGWRPASRPMKYTRGIDSTTLGGMHDESK